MKWELPPTPWTFEGDHLSFHSTNVKGMNDPPIALYSFCVFWFVLIHVSSRCKEQLILSLTWALSPWRTSISFSDPKPRNTYLHLQNVLNASIICSNLILFFMFFFFFFLTWEESQTPKIHRSIVLHISKISTFTIQTLNQETQKVIFIIRCACVLQ